VNSTWLQNWPDHLDHEARTMRLPNNNKLTEDELRLLNMVMRNLPRKVMAYHFHVSIKAIEKRLAKVTDKLKDHPGCTCYNLHGCIEYWGLGIFLLITTKWFERSRDLPTDNVIPWR
jgi:hypothetical protein